MGSRELNGFQLRMVDPLDKKNFTIAKAGITGLCADPFSNRFFYSQKGSSYIWISNLSCMSPRSVSTSVKDPLGMVCSPSRLFVAGNIYRKILIYDLNDLYSPPPSVLTMKYEPRIMTVNKRENIIIATPQSTIQILDLQGTVIRTFGSKGNKPGEFYYPLGLCMDSHDRLVVSDTGNNRIQIFDANSGTVIRQFGSHGNKEKNLYLPRGVCTDSEDNILVADFNHNRVCLFSESGGYIKSLGYCRRPNKIARLYDSILVSGLDLMDICVYKVKLLKK